MRGIVHQGVWLIPVNIKVLDNLLAPVRFAFLEKLFCLPVVPVFDFSLEFNNLDHLEAGEFHPLKNAYAADWVRLIEPSVIFEGHLTATSVDTHRLSFTILARTPGLRLHVIVLNDVADGGRRLDRVTQRLDTVTEFFGIAQKL